MTTINHADGVDNIHRAGFCCWIFICNLHTLNLNLCTHVRTRFALADPFKVVRIVVSGEVVGCVRTDRLSELTHVTRLEVDRPAVTNQVHVRTASAFGCKNIILYNVLL